jgi:hypothetical protein
MELFKPSDKVLEMICSKNKKPLTQYEIYPFGSLEEMENLQMQYCSGIFEKIILFYREDGMALDEESKKRLNHQGIYNVIGESFKNWFDHAPENSNLVTGLFLGSKGVCYGFQDDGDFYKRIDIKKQLENKIPFEKFDENPRGSCGHHGFPDIYENSDFIEVDPKKGVLYLVQLKYDSLIAPEGKRGSEYFYDLRRKNSD